MNLIYYIVLLFVIAISAMVERYILMGKMVERMLGTL